MINRRNFLTHTGAVSLAGIAATLAAVQNVQAADFKAVVVVFLSGKWLMQITFNPELFAL